MRCGTKGHSDTNRKHVPPPAWKSVDLRIIIIGDNP